MLTTNLKKIVDEKWDDCWPVSSLRPIAILDLISYIFFLKKLDDLDLIAKNLSSLESDNYISSREMEDFTWGSFKNKDAQTIHRLFTRQHGIIDLLNEYGNTNYLYSQYFTMPLLLKPSPKLLFTVIQIINLIESYDAATQSAIAEYLLCKLVKEPTEPNFISRLIISISEPVASDFICDVSSGNGDLLVQSAAYINDSHPNNLSFNSHVPTGLKGLESNTSQLRIAAMRMLLHGIKTPDLQIINFRELRFDEKTTLFISNLLPARMDDYTIPEELIFQQENAEKEINLLNSILENMQSGCRVVVLVPETILKSDLAKIQNIRREIVDNTNLEGVIHLFPNGKSYTAAGILIFNKQESKTTEQVWFCKMGKPKKRRTVNESLKDQDQQKAFFSEELNQVNRVLDSWKNRNEPSRNSFFINAYDIKANNYNLNFNDYKLISTTGSVENSLKNTELESEEDGTLIATKKENPHHFFEEAAPLKEPKRKRKVLPTVLIILLIIIAGGWWYLYNDNENPFSKKATMADSVKTFSNVSVQQKLVPSKTDEGEDRKSREPKEALSPARNFGKPTILDSSQEYTVKSKAWFYFEPDSGKRKTLFLQPRTDIILIPSAEQNGFVYVVYTNKRGQSTRGWISKKDLELVE
ncbi:MAG: N-6 DNA methylase [Ginsengibacter sp.]